jgi:hypothetical protein
MNGTYVASATGTRLDPATPPPTNGLPRLLLRPAGHCGPAGALPQRTDVLGCYCVWPATAAQPVAAPDEGLPRLLLRPAGHCCPHSAFPSPPPPSPPILLLPPPPHLISPQSHLSLYPPYAASRGPILPPHTHTSPGPSRGGDQALFDRGIHQRHRIS